MSSSEVAARFRVALDLADTGIELMRQNLRRRHPEADDEKIARLLREWLRSRPPDAPGRLRRLPPA